MAVLNRFTSPLDQARAAVSVARMYGEVDSDELREIRDCTETVMSLALAMPQLDEAELVERSLGCLGNNLGLLPRVTQDAQRAVYLVQEGRLVEDTAFVEAAINELDT